MTRIIAENLSKRYLIGYRKEQNALGKIMSLISGREDKRPLWALKDVSFQASTGEILGIIGKNGSGKSTLLKVIAGILNYEQGRIRVFGKIIPLIYLWAGLQQRLTVRDNIFLVGSIFGLGQGTIRRRFSSIVHFADLADYVDTKLYQLTWGMGERLAFSLALHSDPEILLLDELFEVGDQDFRRKMADKIRQTVRDGGTVIFVSHELDTILKYSHRVLWMDRGMIYRQGSPLEIIPEYQRQGNN